MEAHIQESRSLKDINTTELTIIFARNITHRYMIQQIGRACTLYKSMQRSYVYYSKYKFLT